MGFQTFPSPSWRRVLRGGLRPRVAILYACAGMPSDLVACSVANGARGIVIAGDGNGNMNAATLAEAARAAREGVRVVRGSRVSTGTVGRDGGAERGGE